MGAVAIGNLPHLLYRLFAIIFFGRAQKAIKKRIVAAILPPLSFTDVTSIKKWKLFYSFKKPISVCRAGNVAEQNLIVFEVKTP